MAENNTHKKKSEPIVPLTWHFKILRKKVISCSDANNWEDAKREWVVSDFTLNPLKDFKKSTNMNYKDNVEKIDTCVCHFHPLKNFYEITNRNNGNTLFPIGSFCINRFGRSDMSQQAKLRQQISYFVKTTPNHVNECGTQTGYTRLMIEAWNKLGVYSSNSSANQERYLWLKHMFNQRRPLNDREIKYLNGLNQIIKKRCRNIVE